MVMCGEMGRPVASIFSLYVDMSRRAERVASDRAACIALESVKSLWCESQTFSREMRSTFHGCLTVKVGATQCGTCTYIVPVSRARALRELRVSSQVKSTEYINNRQPSDAF